MQMEHGAGEAGATVVTLESRRRARKRRVEQVRAASRERIAPPVDPLAAAVFAGLLEVHALQVQILRDKAVTAGIPLPDGLIEGLAAQQARLETWAAEIEALAATEVA